MRPLVFLALLGIVAPALAQVPRPRRPAPAPKQPLARRLLRRMVQAELSMPFIAREVLVSSSGSAERPDRYPAKLIGNSKQQIRQ